jgi:aminoglycoside phosphotransferase
MSFENKQKTLPANLGQFVSGYAWQQIHHGLSPSNVFRLESPNKNSLYLKTSPRIPGFSLLREKMRLDWLKNRLPVPEVLLFSEDENTDYLLLSEIPGTPASDDSLKNNLPRVIEHLVNGLKMIHALPIKNCPFDERLDYKIKLVRERMLKGLVDEADFDEERQGRAAADAFRELVETKPSGEDLVFTHGDYCLPNVIFKDAKLNGFVDLGNAGVADRYQDIALLTRSILHNFGEDWTQNIFEIYGIEPDLQKLHFYRLLDEFF